MTLVAYLPILFLIVLASLFAIGSLIAAAKLAPERWTAAKVAPYECGIVPADADSSDRERFPVKFYLIAMLFIIFDIETVFLYPWAVAYDELAVFGLLEMFAFIAILLAAYVYVWKRGGLEWAD